MLAPPFPAAAVEAVRDAAKAHLRIAGSNEDAALAAQAGTALALCEAFTGRALILRAFSEMLGASGAWQRLSGSPVAVIEEVEGVPAEGSAFALPVSGYAVDIDASGDGWVRVPLPGAAGRVRVTYSAGLANDWSEVPAALAQGVVLLAAHLFEVRGIGGAPPVAVAALWRPFRRMRLRAERRA
jgi:uncharacterized phiE125 gp8 family phage protein